MNWHDLIQWPAMITSVSAAWLVASDTDRRRNLGFWIFLGSNVLWTIWAWFEGAWALIAMQFCLAALNIRGARKTA